MKNRRTTIYGAIFLTFLAISIQPELVDFLPQQVAHYIKGISMLVSVVAGLMGFKNAADVTTVQAQTEVFEKKIESITPEKKSDLKVYE